MVLKTAVGTVIASFLLVAAAGCGGAGGSAGDERSAPAASADQWRPKAELPADVRVLVRGGPVDRGGFDYEGAARGVLELQAVLARAEYERDGPGAVLALAAPGSPAADLLESRVEDAKAAASVPAGTYVLRGFEVSGYAADLLQIDVCVDQSDVRLRPADGGPAERRPDPAEDVLWAGFTMRPDAKGAWRAAEIQLTPVGTDPSHHCTE
ncbi:hypothetical protein CLV63_12484 [Murinocardiopsis flavida]|uniref:Lipoprotein n=1 Tax=Murinocardiopsis flavida TaxID=645275 RepID=A0A2P8CYE1_9ACTN|nr:hypothetical protein [Murinocardiopsis flavida]PSK89979.1 hypothetical protein CLV63_12484 [Murinocardiopsis flavida]